MAHSFACLQGCENKGSPPCQHANSICLFAYIFISGNQFCLPAAFPHPEHFLPADVHAQGKCAHPPSPTKLTARRSKTKTKQTNNRSVCQLFPCQPGNTSYRMQTFCQVKRETAVGFLHRPGKIITNCGLGKPCLGGKHFDPQLA